ncbi:MAG TPA: hypothetical protein PKL14_10425 [Holophaga sp.]|jgi:hypothetical protein|nr:hypothetical protein [Holophaga sp.]
MSQEQLPSTQQPDLPAHPLHGLKRVEHYTLYLLGGMAAAGSANLTDGDIDYAIDVAERLLDRLKKRGHLPDQP